MSNTKKTLNDTLSKFRDGYEVEHKADTKRVYDIRHILWRAHHPRLRASWLFIRVQITNPINRCFRHCLARVAEFRKVNK